MWNPNITMPKRTAVLPAALALCAGAGAAQADEFTIGLRCLVETQCFNGNCSGTTDDYAIEIWLNDHGSASDADGGPIITPAGKGEIREGENRIPVAGYRRGMDLRMASLAFPAQMMVIAEGMMDYARYEILGEETGFQTYHGACEVAN